MQFKNCVSAGTGAAPRGLAVLISSGSLAADAERHRFALTERLGDVVRVEISCNHLGNPGQQGRAGEGLGDNLRVWIGPAIGEARRRRR
jgi:hypothetical protein